MNDFRLFENIFPQKETMASETEENNNVTRAWSIDPYHAEVDNSNNLETESNITVNSNEDDITNIDSSVVSIDEFGVTKTLYNLENVTPIEITTSDSIEQELKTNEISLIEYARILNNATGQSLVVNDIEEETVINNSNNDVKETQIRPDTDVSNYINNIESDTVYNKVNDDETMQGLKEFEAALNNIRQPFLTNDFGIEVINLDEFNEIFNELDNVNEDLISVGNVIENNDNGTCSKRNVTDLNNDINSILKDNIGIISINSSTEDEESQTEDIKYTKSINAVPDESDSDDGYNSSDFEFISETEANMATFVINYGLEIHKNLSGASSKPILCCFGEENHQERQESDPGEGPSRQNRPRNEFEDRSYRNDHHIPLGDDYLGLFQGIYNPLLPMSDILFLENKSVRASAMNMQYDGIGFDKQLAMRRHQADSSEDEFEYEAKETAKKILNMYPGDNRKRRRRFL